MKFLTALICCIVVLHLQAQERHGTVFCEAGLGYSFNADGPFNYDPVERSLVSSGNFIHGLKPSFHFGVLTARGDEKLNSVQIGVAARYSRPYYYDGKRSTRDYLEKKFPGNTIQIKKWPLVRVSNMEMGVIAGAGTRKFNVNVECLFGIANMRMPALTITAEKTTDSGVFRSLYIRRETQVAKYITVTPSVTYRRYFALDKYWFIAGELSGNLALKDSYIRYYREPGFNGYRGEPIYNLTPDVYDFFALGLSAGIGISIR
jgi:hypothetical protein